METPGSNIRIAVPATTLQVPVGEAIRLADGTPVRRFKRFMIKIGEKYFKKTRRGIQVIDATRERCDHWLAMWQKAREVGMPIKATKDHEDREAAGSILGDVVAMNAEAGWLAVTMDIRGEDNIKLAEANKDVSIEIDREMVDGKGNKYLDVISAVSFTSIPVIPDQPVSLAASLADEDQEPFRLQLSQEAHMCTRLYGAIARLSGVDPKEINEGNAHEHIEKHLSLCTGIRAEKLALEAKIGELTAQVTKLSTKPEQDTRYLSLESRAAETIWESAAAAGKIDVATKEKGIAMVIGATKDGKREFSKLALSLADEDEAIINLSQTIVDLLAANKPVKIGELTGGQDGVVKLARDVPDGDPMASKTKKVKSPWTGKEIEVAA